MTDHNLNNNQNKVIFLPDTIPIVFSSNDYFIPYMSTMMQSIMENSNPNKNYRFFVLYREIDSNNISLINEQLSFFPNFTVEFIDITQYFKEYNLFISGNYTVEVYFRLLIPYIFSEYQKVLYLDGDMICCTDIASLFDIDINDNILAGVMDLYIISYFYNQNFTDNNEKKKYDVLLNLKKPINYFNSGLLIINIELFNKTISMEKLLEIAKSREWQHHDQDILNSLFGEKTLILSINWNLLNSTHSRLKYLPSNLQNEINEAIKNPKIIHYKPWNYENYIINFELFWKYATRTPFINVIIERMKNNNIFSEENFLDRVISNIKHRKGVGLRFILIDCLKAWFTRDKENRES